MPTKIQWLSDHSPYFLLIVPPCDLLSVIRRTERYEWGRECTQELERALGRPQK